MSYTIKTETVSVNITETGGMLTASFGGVEPFKCAPWTPEACSDALPPLLKYLRGDFDCWFGANATPVEGVQHLPHGDPCNLQWEETGREESDGGAMLQLEMTPSALPGKVLKKVLLYPEHPVVYTQTLNCVDAQLSAGHHANLRIPESADYHISTSPFVLGRTFPEPFLDAGAKPRLAVDAQFESLAALPLKDGSTVDISKYYKQKGCDDLMMISSGPDAAMAWAALTNREEKYVFFTLKDPRVLASTMFWFSHFGRDGEPWGLNGTPRHGFSLGMEDVTALFALGIAESCGEVEAYRPLLELYREKGIKTCLDFTQANPPPINYIMACVRVPAGFRGVADIRKTGSGIELVDFSGGALAVPVCTEWLQAGASAGMDFLKGGNR
jgi:hypothetical protein